jgi:hypothetical protein
MKHALSAIAFAVSALAAASASAATYVGTIYTGAQDTAIFPGDMLYSPNYRYLFKMEYDGRLVTYRLSDYKIVYQSTSAANPIAGASHALLKRDISFGIYSTYPWGYPTQAWTNGTAQPGVTDPLTTLTLKNDGQLELAGKPHPGSPWPNTIWWVSPRDNWL